MSRGFLGQQLLPGRPLLPGHLPNSCATIKHTCGSWPSASRDSTFDQTLIEFLQGLWGHLSSAINPWRTEHPEMVKGLDAIPKTLHPESS